VFLRLAARRVGPARTAGQADLSALAAGGETADGVDPALWAGVGDGRRFPLAIPSSGAARLRRAAREEKNAMRAPASPGPEALAFTRLRRAKADEAA